MYAAFVLKLKIDFAGIWTLNLLFTPRSVSGVYAPVVAAAPLVPAGKYKWQVKTAAYIGFGKGKMDVDYGNVVFICVCVCRLW
jgi:hypothetical protein